MLLQRNIINTSDGSQTIEIPEWQVTYHSHHGAVQESRHVFIEAGLRPLLQRNTNQINILEIGFGTGLNALLTLAETAALPYPIRYTAIELFPLDTDIVSLLEYDKIIGFKSEFEAMHQATWGEKVQISANFELLKLQTPIETFEQTGAFDLIYFDAFSPVTQPELWSETVMQLIFDALSAGGVLTTYCAKGVVKRTLKSVGFRVESLAGPPGKREMTRATKA